MNQRETQKQTKNKQTTTKSPPPPTTKQNKGDESYSKRVRDK